MGYVNQPISGSEKVVHTVGLMLADKMAQPAHKKIAYINNKDLNETTPKTTVYLIKCRSYVSNYNKLMPSFFLFFLKGAEF